MIGPAIQAALGQAVITEQPLHGGNLSEVRLVGLQDGSQVVAKSGPHTGIEARMLTALADAGAPVPRVLHHSPNLIVLEYLLPSAATPGMWRGLGQSLRALHGTGGGTIGWPEDYAFGPVTLHNNTKPDWTAFWAQNRLLADSHTLPKDIRQRIDLLVPRLPDLIADRPIALLHGDLWSGNVHFSQSRAYMIDPASYYGDPEVDLAMLTLFGQPPQAFFDGYGAIGAGFRNRCAVYQLWPALVHLRLFGAGYRHMVGQVLDRLKV